MKALSPPKSPLIITALQLGLLVLTIYYTFIGGQTAQGLYDHRWRLITLWLTTLLIGSWLLLRLIGRHKIPCTPFDLPLLFLFAAWLLATLFSVNPVYSQETMVFFIIYIFVFYLAADLGRWPWLMELTFNAVIAVSGLVWTLAAWQLLHWYQNLPPLPLLLQGHQPPLAWLRLSVLGNPNTMASFIALVFPIVLYKLTVVRRLISRLLLLVWLGLLLAAALLTQSRGGIVGLVAAGGFFLLVWAWSRRGNGSPQTFSAIGRKPGVWLPALALLLAGLVLGGWLLLSRRDVSGAVDIRQQVMVGALETWQAQPLFGSGPGTLGEELLRRQQQPGFIWPDAHNLLLTLTAETGLIGLIGLLWLAVVGVQLLWTTLRQPDRSTWPLASLACLAGLLGFMAHNLVDSLFKFPLIMLLVAAWVGFWVSAYVSQPNPAAQTIGIDVRKSFLQSFWAGIRRHLPFRVGDYFLRFSSPNPPIPAKTFPGDYGYWPWPVTIVALLILAATTLVGVSHIRHIAVYNQAVAAADQNDWSTARDYLQQATELAPNLSFYRRQLGLVSGYLSTQNDPAGPAQRQQAIDHYWTALAGLDRLAIDHANLACLLGQAGQPEAASRELALALELEPNQPLYALNLGYYLEQMGDYQAAWSHYADVLAARPDYLQSAYWTQTQPRREALPAIIVAAAQKLAERKAPAALLQLYLYAGDLESAWQVYERSLVGETVDGQLARGRLLLAEQRLAEAQGAYEAALALDPAAGEVYLGFSRIALAQQRVPEAVQLAEAALFLTENPDTLYQAALALTAAGAGTRAIELYEAAFMQLTAGDDPNLARYATEVARRRPQPLNTLPCLIQLYPMPRLVDLTLAEGKLLAQQGDYATAARVYQRLLAVEPETAVVRAALATLCRRQPQVCDLRANE